MGGGGQSHQHLRSSFSILSPALAHTLSLHPIFTVVMVVSSFRGVSPSKTRRL